MEGILQGLVRKLRLNTLGLVARVEVGFGFLVEGSGPYHLFSLSSCAFPLGEAHFLKRPHS